MNKTPNIRRERTAPLHYDTGALRGGVPLEWGLVKTRLRAAAEPRERLWIGKNCGALQGKAARGIEAGRPRPAGGLGLREPGSA
jgi:hypothetical protein